MKITRNQLRRIIKEELIREINYINELTPIVVFLSDRPDLIEKLGAGIYREIGNDLQKLAELLAVMKEMGLRGQLQAVFERAGGEEAGIGAILDAALTQLQYM